MKLLTNDQPSAHHPTDTYSHRCRSRMTNRYCYSDAICRPGRLSGPVRQVSLRCCRGRPTRTVHARALLRYGHGSTTTTAAAAQSSPTSTPPPTRAREGSHCCSTGSHVFVCALRQRVEALRRHCRQTAVVCALLTSHFSPGGSSSSRSFFLLPPAIVVVALIVSITQIIILLGIHYMILIYYNIIFIIIIKYTHYALQLCPGSNDYIKTIVIITYTRCPYYIIYIVPTW